MSHCHSEEGFSPTKNLVGKNARAGGVVAHWLSCTGEKKKLRASVVKNYNTKLSINRVFPTRAATTTSAPRETSLTGSSDSLSTISK